MFFSAPILSQKGIKWSQRIESTGPENIYCLRKGSQSVNEQVQSSCKVLSSNKGENAGQQRGPTSEQVAPVPCAEDGHELHLIRSPSLLPSFIQALKDMNKVRIIAYNEIFTS